MEPTGLFALSALARERSWAAAGTALGVAATTARRRVARLERALGVRLVRTTAAGGARLTPAGILAAEAAAEVRALLRVLDTLAGRPGEPRGPTFAQLRLVAAVRAAGSLHRAAARLHSDRSALGRMVARTERSLGVTLFERDPTGATPTAAGHAVADIADRITGLLVGLHARLRTARVAQPAHPPDPTGFAPRAVRSASGLPDEVWLDVYANSVDLLLAELAAIAPGTGWRTRPFAPGGSERALAAGRTDLVLGYATPRCPAPASPGVAHQVYVEEPIWLAVGRGHRLARRASVDLADLAGEHWVVAPTGPLRGLIEDACAAHGFAPLILHESADVRAVRRLVGSGAVVTLAGPAGVPDDELALVPLHRGPTRALYLAWREPDWSEVQLHDLLAAAERWYLALAHRNPAYLRRLTAQA